MKNIFLFSILVVSIISCNKNIDVLPQSNLYDEVYYKDYDQFNAALTGCYNGLQKPMLDEWSLTELRSDNAIMGNPTSGSIPNRELSDLDLLIPNPAHERIYNYWLNSYYNIYNVNKIMSNLAIKYDSVNGVLNYDTTSIPITQVQRKKISSEASFIRAYHYFNLVRLFGGVFLIHKPVSPAESKFINRSSVSDIYKLIIADLKNTVDYGNGNPYQSIGYNDLGRVNSWSAKALLAKVYLTLNMKSEAIPLLQDIIANSGYKLQSTYADVFSITNEMNAEILFTVRYKSGKIGLGSPFANMFAASSSGNYIVNGDGDGYDYPAYDLDSIRPNSTTPANNFDSLRGSEYDKADPRRSFNIKKYGTKLYCSKYISNLIYEDDGENDWPVIRYADVLLMLAEAQGFIAPNSSSVQLINQIRTRVGLTSVNPQTVDEFYKYLSRERRFEFAFENQRWFDLVRFNTTLKPHFAEDALKSHFTYMYNAKGGNHYNQYLPMINLDVLLSQVNQDHLLLPIPRREIDNNTNIVIAQNPGY